MNITIINDDISENLEEIFIAQIDAIDAGDITGADIGDTPSATVTIVDDDGKIHSIMRKSKI